ncbi:MAG: hypothetical protein GY778_21680, partial [bacterium]|nr:hypothetical protein [bacterium]
MAKIPEPTRFSSSWPIALAVIGIVVGVVIRVWDLDSRPLWLDEAFSHLYANLPWSEVIELRRTGTNPPLYHFLLSGWVALFGPSAAALRSLSVLFGVGAIGMMLGLARRLVGPRPAAGATARLAVSNLSIAYAPEAPLYAATPAFSP